MSGPSFGCVAGIRADATALPFLVADLCGRPLIQRVFERTRAATLLDQVFVLTSSESCDDPLAERLAELGLPYRRGPRADVRARYLDLAEETRAQFLVRVDGTRPLVDADLIDLSLGALRALGADLVDLAGIVPEHEAFSARALRYSLASSDGRDAEGVGHPFFARRPECLAVAALELAGAPSGFQGLSVDGSEALALARRVHAHVDHEGDGLFPLARALRWLSAQPGALLRPAARADCP